MAAMSASEPSGDPDAQTDRGEEDVHSILSGIAAEGELARIAARLEELEGEIGRLGADLEGERAARGGEVDVMRARVEDALNIVGDATDEQRRAWTELDRRLDGVRQQLDDRLAAVSQDLREEMATVRERSAAINEETELRLQADITELIAGLEERISSHVERRMEMEGRRSTALESRLEAVIEEEGQRWLEGLERGVRGLRDAIGEISSSLEHERDSRGEADRSLNARLDELAQRLERTDGRSETASRRAEVELSKVERRLAELADRVERLEDGGSAGGGADTAAVIADLSERVERAETIAREAGRAIVGALRRQRGEDRPGVASDREGAEAPATQPAVRAAGEPSPLRLEPPPDAEDRLF